MDHEFAHRRRSIRIDKSDYSQPGAYFITICAHNRMQYFEEVKNGELVYSRLGNLVDYCWKQIPIHNEHINLDEYVIMPNHMHGIVEIDIGCRGTIYLAPTRNEQFGAPVKRSIPTIVRTNKAAVTRACRKDIDNPSFIVWQRNYYERVIRSDFELNTFRRYILTNPLRWELDRYYSPA